MIARSWRGRVRAHDAEAYYRYLMETGLADYGRIPGCEAIHPLRRQDSDVVEYRLMSLWRDEGSIRDFAGHDPLRARYYPEDARYLLEMEPHVTHHEVVASPAVALDGAGVARVWRGWTDAARAGAYERFLLEEMFPWIGGQTIPGYLGIHLLRRTEGDEREFVTVMWFDSMESVARFSDPSDPERAVVHEPARRLLSRFDERSRHYEAMRPG
jgi:heme-degrading monooxygenase HmoA